MRRLMGNGYGNDGQVYMIPHTRGGVNLGP